MSRSQYSEVFNHWGEELGDEYVLTSPDQIAAYNKSLIPIEQEITGVVRPSTHAEVVTVVKTANEHEIPIAPISRGKNWGYGSAQPPADGTVILDLGRLDRIKTVDEALGYAVIEPAVTPGQLHEYLERNDIDLVIDPPGAGPNTSFVGNALERGLGAGRNYDRFGAMCSLQVVLPTGETVNTGFGAFDNARSTQVYKYGVGPYVTGIFSQSNFGVVTKAGLWLAPKPDHVELFFVQVNGRDQMAGLIEPIKDLYRYGVAEAPIVVANRNRALTLSTQCPDEYLGREIPDHVLERMADEHDVADLNLVGVLYGTSETISGKKREVKNRFEGNGFSVSFVSERRLDRLERLPGPVRAVFGSVVGTDLESQLPVLRNILELFKGVPSERSLRTAYWRTGTSPPERDIDPTEANCGVYWVSPVVPLRESDVQEFLTCAKEVFNEYHLEFCLNFDAISERAAICLIPILFNGADAAEAEVATELYEHLHERFLEEGFIPFRESIMMMDEIAGESNYWSLCRSIKSAIDPNRILTPGRYEQLQATSENE